MSTIDVRHSRASLPSEVGNHAESAAATAATALSLRLGLGYVFLTFGAEKIVDWRGWAVMFPPAFNDLVHAWSGLTIDRFLCLAGYVEVVFGLHLVIGLFTRATACGCALILAFAVALMGRTGIGVRDVGLLATALALAFAGGGSWSLDGMRRRHEP